MTIERHRNAVLMCAKLFQSVIKMNFKIDLGFLKIS